MFSLHNATLNVVKMILGALKISKIEIVSYAIKSDKEFWDLLFECKEVQVLWLVNLQVTEKCF